MNPEPRESGVERGSAIIMAVFVLMLLTGMGVALLHLSQTEVKMSQASLRTKQAFYLAEAAIEDARLVLYSINGARPFDDDLADVAVDGTIDFDAANLQPLFDGDGNLTGFTGYGNDLPYLPLVGFGGGSVGFTGQYAAFLTNDPIEMSSPTDTNDRVMITGVGAGPHGSLEVVQAIVERAIVSPPMPPAAITILGSNPTYDGGSSGSKEYSGDDCDGDGVPGLSVPTVAVVGSDAQQAVVDNLGSNGTYRSGDETDAATIVDVTAPGSGGIDPLWTDCELLRDMIMDLRDVADVRCRDEDFESGGECLLPSPSSPESIIYVDSNYTAPDGEGLLIVIKTLIGNGGWNWKGLVLVVGTGDMRRTGGGPGTISGGLVVANIAGPDRELFTDDDCSEGADGFADATYNVNGGGNSLVTFCLRDVTLARPERPYEVLHFLQR